MKPDGTIGERVLRAIDPEEWGILEERLGLPPRQMQVMRAILADPGHSKPQVIALQLGIQPTSIKKHTQKLYRKLGATSKAEAVAAVFLTVMSIRSTPRGNGNGNHAKDR